VAALARRSQHPELNRYQPTRAPWAHAFFPGLDHRLGKFAPADAIIEEAIAEHIVPERQEDVRAIFSCPLRLPGEDWLAYNRRLVSPRLGLSPAEQRRCANVLTTLAPALAPAGAIRAAPPTPEEKYSILDTGGMVVLPFERNIPLGQPGILYHAVAETPAPVYVVSAAWNYFGNVVTNQQHFRVELDPWGTLVTRTMDGGSFSESAPLLPIGLLLRRPAVLTIDVELTSPFGAGPEMFSGFAAVVYRDVHGLRALPRPEAGTSPGDVPGSPYIQLDPSISDVFDQAGIPDDWYIIRPDEPLALP
jgi:hypothetical protein